MPLLHPAFIQIPSVVDDMIMIEINDQGLNNTDISYCITDSVEHICRKGQFRGLRVQLRLSHLKDGIYSFTLHSCSQDECSFSFEKISGRIFSNRN
ncbi:MAG: hypothetical protein QM802_01610 [Agriterribacter sp.]